MRGREVRIRAPRTLEAEAVARLQLACWREAYAELVDATRLAPYLADVEGAVARWRGILAGTGEVRVAEADGGLVGFASVRAAGEDAPAHLSALYVRQSHWGTGLGRRLLDATLGRRAATLEVFRDNDRARRFYARNGFVPDGRVEEDAHWGGTEIGMVRPEQPA